MDDHRIFNVGSPYNVIAGQGGANLDKVIEKYERANREIEEKKLKKLAQRREEKQIAEEVLKKPR